MLGPPQYCKYMFIMNILSDTNEFHLLHQPVLGDGPFTRHMLNKNATAMLAWEPGCTPGTIGNTRNTLIKCSNLLDKQVTPYTIEETNILL
jgi:hypothetical protein